MEPSLVDEVAVVVLAGGKSRRMGRDKALLPISPHTRETFLERAYRIAWRSFGNKPARVFISGNYSGFECIDDLFPGFGPLSGIHSALNRFRSTAVRAIVFIPVDMPRLRTEDLRLLARHSLCSDQIVCFSHSVLPIVIPNSREIYYWMHRLFTCDWTNTESFSVHHLLQTFPHEQLTIVDSTAADFVNVNDQSEYDLWHRSGSGAPL